MGAMRRSAPVVDASLPWSRSRASWAGSPKRSPKRSPKGAAEAAAARQERWDAGLPPTPSSRNRRASPTNRALGRRAGARQAVGRLRASRSDTGSVESRRDWCADDGVDDDARDARRQQLGISRTAGILFDPRRRSPGPSPRASFNGPPSAGESLPVAADGMRSPKNRRSLTKLSPSRHGKTYRKSRQKDVSAMKESMRVDRIMSEGRAHHARRAAPCCRVRCLICCGDWRESSHVPIDGFIIIGDRADAKSRAALVKKGVTHVLNTAKSLPNYHESHFLYCKLKMQDSATEELDPHLERAFDFLDAARKLDAFCMVHCIAGVSRSVSVVMAYLVVRREHTLLQASRAVKKHRPLASPNDSFLFQLAQLEIRTLGGSSVATTRDRMWNFYRWNVVKRTVPILGRRGVIPAERRRKDCCGDQGPCVVQ